MDLTVLIKKSFFDPISFKTTTFIEHFQLIFFFIMLCLCKRLLLFCQNYPFWFESRPYSSNLRPENNRFAGPLHCPCIRLMHSSRISEILDHLLPLYHCEIIKKCQSSGELTGPFQWSYASLKTYYEYLLRFSTEFKCFQVVVIKLQ